MAPLIVVLFVGIAIACAGWSWLEERQRREALAALARSLGMHFTPGNDGGHDDEYSLFEVFHGGNERSAHNTLRGHIELFGGSCVVVMGDFRYVFSSGKSRQTFHFSYLIVHPPWSSATLLVRPEGPSDKLLGALGFDDIDFESAEFSRKFHVQSNDKRFAYDVLHPRMMEFLLATRPLMFELEGGALCVSDGERLWTQAAFRAQMDFVRRFGELWPRHLVKDQVS
ncbi:MAG: DUF3137 domain-containing protein [Planctomycetes bacterium]|nr:DUF3137 domain-containing protein [Planctomycetota bacterium]